MELKEIKMTYHHYKNKYSDYQTVVNSYDKATKTIVVLLPSILVDKLEKKVGNRLQRAYIKFSDNNEAWDKMFNYFTEEGLEEQIKKYENEFNCNRI